MTTIPYRPRVALAPKEELFPDSPAAPVVRSDAPQSAAEAEGRFWARYGSQLGMSNGTKPATVADWIAVAESIRDLLKAPAPAPAGDALERMAVAVERMATALERGGTTQTAAAPAARKKHPPAVFDGEGEPCCPYHPDRPLVEGDYGPFCSAKGGAAVNAKGYCGWKG
jgi:hypothetical protein